MGERGWERWAPPLADDAALLAAVMATHQALLREALAAEPALNTAIQIEVRASRRIEDWRVMLLLTPWMLVRLLFPDTPPEIAVPEGWDAEGRGDAPYQVLGPRCSFRLLGMAQTAHLCFQPTLGHYLLQPICLDLQPYRDADAVLEAWSHVIGIRDENLEQARRECPMQREVSRREFFTRFRS